MKNEKKDTRMTKGMTAFYLLLTLVGGVAIIVSMIKTQWVDGEDWRERGMKRESGFHTDPARRGNIYSSDGKILATTVKECDLFLDLYNEYELDDHGNRKLDRKGHAVERGPIVDSCFEQYVDTVGIMLADAMGGSVSYFANKIRAERAKNGQMGADGKPMKARRCFSVAKGVPYSVWLDISRLPGWRRGVVHEVDHESVVHHVRAHIYGNMAENTVGYPNAKTSGTYTGLEGAYDSILRGQDGNFIRRRLTKGVWLAEDPGERRAVPQRTDGGETDTIVLQRRVDGQSIVSTIDTRYQDIAESSLRKALSQYGGTSGCAILMEMETGYVLACSNLVMDTTGRYAEVQRGQIAGNVAVSHINEPGSTFKTVILTAMLEDKQVKIDTSMKVKAVYKDFGGKYGAIKDSHRKRDSLSVKEVIEESSNVGMCDLGWMYYQNRRNDLVNLVKGIFPFEKLHLDLATTENASHVNNVNLSNRDFLNFCYGYSTAVSPMQLITFYNALGAGGRMVKPLFCKAIIEGNRQREVKPVVLNPQICSRETAALMKELLESVVENGTGNNIKNNTYGIAGKTGTAVHSYADKSRYNGSFAGFFPSENPRYTCLVVIENSPAYGRQAAVVFKAIADCVVAVDKELSKGAVKSAWPQLKADSTKALQQPVLEKGNQQGIAAAYGLIGKQYVTTDPGSEWVYYRAANDSLSASYVPYAPMAGKVPNCYGMSAKDAVALLNSMGFRTRVSGYGKVASQQPKGGAVAKDGSVVVLNLK